MFQISANLPELEAISFANSIKKDEPLFIVKTKVNPKERHKYKRVLFAVVRHPRKNEMIRGNHALLAERSELQSV
jgi:hypothetical protein